MTPTTHVFVYGSNLDPERMARRCPSARIVLSAHLPGHRLDFGGTYTRDGVAQATPAPGALLRGVVYALTASDLARLDEIEGHPHVYTRRRKVVATLTGDPIEAWVYMMPPERFTRYKPASPYLSHVRAGHIHHGFPQTDLDAAVARAMTNDPRDLDDRPSSRNRRVGRPWGYLDRG